MCVLFVSPTVIVVRWGEVRGVSSQSGGHI